MAVETRRFIRKPLFVDAVRVTAGNFDEVAVWCGGVIHQAEAPNAHKNYIKVSVHIPKNVRQTQAFVGDWILYTERGYKVYTNKAFRTAFDEVTAEEAPLSDPRLTGDPVADMRAGQETARAVVIMDEPTVEDVPEQENVVPEAVEGKRVLSIEEQQALTADEIREMVQSGEFVLVQDIAQP